METDAADVAAEAVGRNIIILLNISCRHIDITISMICVVDDGNNNAPWLIPAAMLQILFQRKLADGQNIQLQLLPTS